MASTAKVENYCIQHRIGTKAINIERTERMCVNCIWFDQYFRETRGNICGKVPVNVGYCLRRRQRRGATGQPCKHYETPEEGVEE